MNVAKLFHLTQNKELRLKFGVSGLLITLISLQLLYFNLSQFIAITTTQIQLAISFVLFAYCRWYFGTELRKKPFYIIPGRVHFY